MSIWGIAEQDFLLFLMFVGVPCLAMVVNWFWDRSERQIFAEKPKRS